MHDRLAEQWGGRHEFTLGTLRAEILAMAWPCGATVADLGCGTGFLADWLAGRGARVVAIDHSERMVAQARRHATHEIDFRRGEFDALPLGDGEVNAAFANLVWHHLADHDAAAREVFRVLQPGGTLVISDLAPHECEWMREVMGELRLGLKSDQVLTALARAGFEGLATESAHDRYRVGPRGKTPTDFDMFLVRGRKPAAGQAVSD